MLEPAARSVSCLPRNAARRIECKNHLKQIGISIAVYQDAHPESLFPVGTHSNPRLPPEKRLSWQAQLLPYIEAIGLQFDWDQPWDIPKNRYPKALDMEGTIHDFAGEFHIYVCPANPQRTQYHRAGTS